MTTNPSQRRNFWIYSTLAVVAAILAFFTLQPTEEARVRGFIESGVAAVERENLSRIEESLHPDYQDSRGHDKSALLARLNAAFQEISNLVIETEIEGIRLGNEGDTVEVQVKLRISGEIDGNPFQGFLSEAGGVDHVSLGLEKYQGHWRLKRAELQAPAAL